MACAECSHIFKTTLPAAFGDWDDVIGLPVSMAIAALQTPDSADPMVAISDGQP
jgi:hypothetical protein